MISLVYKFLKKFISTLIRPHTRTKERTTWVIKFIIYGGFTFELHEQLHKAVSPGKRVPILDEQLAHRLKIGDHHQRLFAKPHCVNGPVLVCPALEGLVERAEFIFFQKYW
jgi:hypothetical protein